MLGQLIDIIHMHVSVIYMHALMSHELPMPIYLCGGANINNHMQVSNSRGTTASRGTMIEFKRNQDYTITCLS